MSKLIPGSITDNQLSLSDSLLVSLWYLSGCIWGSSITLGLLPLSVVLIRSSVRLVSLSLSLSSRHCTYSESTAEICHDLLSACPSPSSFSLSPPVCVLVTAFSVIVYHVRSLSHSFWTFHSLSVSLVAQILVVESLLILKAKPICHWQTIARGNGSECSEVNTDKTLT